MYAVVYNVLSIVLTVFSDHRAVLAATTIFINVPFPAIQLCCGSGIHKYNGG